MVYYVTRQIPKGRVSTYGAIADYLSLGSARMVGWALTQSNRSAIGLVPAHRVVNSKGILSGRLNFATPTQMQESLESEGVTVINDKVKDFKKFFWHPEEMEL
jgi:methylated-DNA-protein-cysteine methyltransferase-like protein